MNPPPLPQPAAQTCPNCGAPAPENAALCPQCGAALKNQKSGGCLVVAAQLVLVLLASVFGLGGACFVLIGGFGGVGSVSSPTFGELAPFIGGGLLGLGLAAACVWGIIRLGKRGQ